MGKLSVGLWSKAGMQWLKGPSEFCKRMFGMGITKDQYEKYATLQMANKKADSFEMMSEGDERLKELMSFADYSEDEE